MPGIYSGFRESVLRRLPSVYHMLDKMGICGADEGLRHKQGGVKTSGNAGFLLIISAWLYRADSFRRLA
jgi:hypothetical protein